MKDTGIVRQTRSGGNFLPEERGTAGVEYAVLISVTVSLLVAGMYFYVNVLETLYNNLAGKLF